jgi:hypothetical protein
MAMSFYGSTSIFLVISKNYISLNREVSDPIENFIMEEDGDLRKIITFLTVLLNSVFYF